MRRGDEHAVIVEVGAGLRSYTVGGVDVIDGYGSGEMCDGGRGQLLIPWPNRIRGGRYRFDGLDNQLPLSEPALGNAIHGLVHWSCWRTVRADAENVVLSLELPPQPGYPFSLLLEAEYSLCASGLRTRLTARNRGDRPCPYGAGAHPYVRLARDSLIDDAVLHVPAPVTLVADAHSIPTGRQAPVAGTRLDFRSPRRIGDVRLDTAYAQPQAGEDGLIRVSLTSADGDRRITVWMDDTHHFIMVYSGDTLADPARRRRGLAVEPMTCAPDAFNSGLGLVVLQPGEECSTSWGIRATTGAG